MNIITSHQVCNNDMRIVVTSPAFWGSLIGIFIGSIISGLAYIGAIGPRVELPIGEVVAKPHAIVVIFCCLLCIRYYASIIFLTYDDTASPRVRALEVKSRRSIFFIQLLLIVGCTLNIALLPLFGATVATGVIVAQASLIGEYWRRLWRVLLIEDPESRFKVVIAIGDITILVSAVIFFAWENGWGTYDETGAGMIMGAIIFVFVVESATTYFGSIRSFLLDTANALRSSNENKRQ